METQTNTQDRLAEDDVDMFLRDVFQEHLRAELPEHLQTLVDSLREREVDL